VLPKQARSFVAQPAAGPSVFSVSALSISPDSSAACAYNPSQRRTASRQIGGGGQNANVLYQSRKTTYAAATIGKRQIGAHH